MKFLMIFTVILLLSCSDDKNVNAVEDIEIRNVAVNLDTPWEILWGPGDMIWMTERYGRISKVDPESGEVEEIMNIEDVDEFGEGGLMGMVLHPDFENTPHIFLSHTYLDGSDAIIRLLRYTYTGTELTEPQIILDNIAGSAIHDGSRLWIDKNMKLYMTIGDGAVKSRSQDNSNLNGTVLRMNLDGSVPEDNPIDGKLIYAYGLRNSQGLVFAKDNIYVSDHGPDTDDEVNLIEAGRNYGWPQVRGFCDTPNEEDFCNEHNVAEPLKAWTPTLAVAGLDYYGNGPIDDFNNSLLLMTLKASRLVRLKLNEDGTSITDQKYYYTNDYGRLRDLCISPDGRVFIATSNRDGRGNPADVDDRIIELKAKETSVHYDQETNLKIYPNPSSDKFTFNFPETYAKIDIRIFDNLGSEIIHRNYKNKNSLILDLSQLTYNGVLTALINTGSRQITKKLLLID